MILVLIALVLAGPVAYLVMERWLQHFAYRVDVGPWLFVGASVLAMAIALATAGYHALRAAHTDPAEALRYE